MSLGDRGRDATLENALSRAPRFGLPEGEARTIVQQIRARTASWRNHFEEFGVSAREIDLLAPSFALS